MKRLFLITALVAISSIAMDKPTTPDESENLTFVELIKKGQYGPELARKLDAWFQTDGYTYTKHGLYERHNGIVQHSLPRHLCEPGVDIKQAEATRECWNKKYRDRLFEMPLDAWDRIRADLESEQCLKQLEQVSANNNQFDIGPIFVKIASSIHLFKMVDGKLVDQGLKIPASKN